MIKHLIIVLIFVFAIGSNTAHAQLFAEKNYPQGYFVWPVGAPKAIVANFGELRSNHFHMGLDCRTEAAVNKPIYAAANGYVSRIKIEPWGFGRAIYITHPNGFTTLYAHLNDFYPELERYVKEQQYARKSWALNLDIPEGQFAVRQGQFIAYSGNTGGSMGPHLHWEIRNTKTDKVLNPLLFGMPIPDNQAPDILRLAVYDRSKSTYEQVPRIYPLKRVGNNYTLANGPISFPSQKVSFAITAWDRYTGSTNQNGIYQAVVFDNGKAISGFQLDEIDYIETRDLNGHIDYKSRATGGPWLQHLSKLPAMTDAFYKTSEGLGITDLSDGNAHNIRIEVSDANNNKGVLNFSIRSSGVSQPAPLNGAEPFSPLMLNVFERENVQFYIPAGYLYDSVNFIYRQLPGTGGRVMHQLHTATVPLLKFITIKLKDNILATPTDKMVMKRSFGSKKDYKKAVYENGWYKADFREFGFFELIIDSTPPVVTPVGFANGMNASKLSRIVFTVKDDSDDIDSFEAYLNGNWLRFTNDKGKNFIYNFDEKCGPGSHELKIIVKDIVGNTTEKTYNFTR